MASRTGSQVICDALRDAGVETVFGYPGGAIMPLYDGLLDSGLNHILTRHEQSAIHAADGLARATGKLGVCLATSGPGATNLVTGICTAQMDSAPVLCITGQVPSTLIGTDAFQEADVPGIVTAITKQTYQVKSVDELPRIMAEAIFLATTGRPGPVVVDVPKDVQIARTDQPTPKISKIRGYEPKPQFDSQDLAGAHAMFKKASKPVVIVGGGCRMSDATAPFRAFCDLTQVPVITTLMGIGCCDPDYAGWLGMPGMHGHRRCNRAISECDLIVAMGIRFDDRVTGALDRFAPNAGIIHIDIDEAELGKLVRTDVPIHGDLREVLDAWNRLLTAEPIERFESWRDEAMAIGDGLADAQPSHENAVPPTALLDAVLALAGRDTIVTTDVGQHQMWAAQRVKCASPKYFITSGGAGTMGFGLPSAMGAQFGCPNQKVLAIVGDGGFQMTMAEMATIRRCNLPVKVLVMDNKYLGMVRQWQELFFERRYSGVDLSDNPDFAALARVYGIEAFSLNRLDAMSSTLSAWWNCDGPALLHAVCRLEENVFPMVPAGAGLSEMVESA